MTTATCTKAQIAIETAKTAGQSFKKSVIIEGFADRSEDEAKESGDEPDSSSADR